MNPDGAYERDVRALGERIFELAGEDVPTVFDRRWWSGKVLEWSMRNEAFKVELFRFVDVFPQLRSAEEVARHLQEYFCRPGQNFPAAFQWGLRAVSPRSPVARAAALAVRKNVESMAQRFIGGRDGTEALPVLRELWDDGVAFTVDLLGEAALSARECETYLREYERLIDGLAAEVAGWPERPGLESSPEGALPRANVSVKVSSLYWKLDPVDFDGSVSALVERLVPLLRRARTRGVFVNLDVEQNATRAITYAAFERALEDPGLRDFPDVGIVCQAYQRDAEEDLASLARLARSRGTPVTVRLVKGAYWDYETVLADQNGHGCPVYRDKAATDASFERCARRLIEEREWLRPAIATHSVRSLAAVMTLARSLDVPDSSLEIQMLRGMAEPLARAVRGLGYRTREYVPVGELVPGMAYLVRRLLENTSNESFLRASFVEQRDRATLLACPEPSSRELDPEPRGETDPTDPTPFRNEPTRDFTRADVRAAFGRAVDDAERALETRQPKASPLLIAGTEVETDDVAHSLDPAFPLRSVGQVCQAGVDDVDRAVAGALQAWPTWREAPAAERAGLLFRTARALRDRRDEFAALEVFEVGKPWREADADVCEAIDFLEYYGRRMLELEGPHRTAHVPGETNELVYEGRGPCAVIAPWNFPLAILTGMTSAALVTGNPVLMKPAETSAVVAARFVELLREAGAPPGVVSFVPGPGEVVGAALVAHPDVATIAFTGSLEVGQQILEAAARPQAGQTHLKRVVAELGGKNAIVVDGDADLDEAVAGVVTSAFGYAGQKCSACSRVIVVEAAHDDFVRRLVDAVESLEIGPPDVPTADVGPLVSEERQRAVREWQEVAERDGRILVRRPAPVSGYYVGPTVVAELPPDHALLQEEIFGPILALQRARDMDHALELANESRFALTAGLYSRSPAHIERARSELRVGNLYINRPCTGALVERQPFGGFKLSGVGSKAGGPDYLLQFLETRTLTENTLRRGFSPGLTG